MKIGVLGLIHSIVFPLYRPSPLGAAIIESMGAYPDDWNLADHTVKHIPSGVEIWSSNGVSYLEIYGAPEGINTKRASKSLSWGDRIAIDELIAKLRNRHVVSNDAVKVIEILKKQTD